MSALYGLLNVDKPSGVTSREAVNRVARLVRRTKIGHAGTLDPLATGVLVLCLGVATRLVPRIHEFRKGYRAGLRLGETTDTDDATGRVLSTADASCVSTADVETVLGEFHGEIAQVPPRFSAVHVEGRRAYDLARDGREFALSPRTVVVESVRLVSRTNDEIFLDIVCGSGTYVRALIRDIGERLGCGAVMTSLRRTFVGPFCESEAVPLDRLTPETVAERLLPLSAVLENEPRHMATAEDCAALLQGRGIPVSDTLAAEEGRIAVLDPTRELYAFAAVDRDRRLLLPQQVFVR
jgi:tRNA pseudouridine55 synthase